MKKTGFSFGTILGLIFIVLKLCNIISWSWVWVLSPFWISWGISFLIIIVTIIIALISKKGNK